MATEMNQRASAALRALAREYIRAGEPVGSRTLARVTGMNLSPATMRNIMADLEERGFLTSAHASAGRVPSERGMRFFVDTLLSAETAESVPGPDGTGGWELSGETPGAVLDSAASAVSELTRFVGLVAAPSRGRPVVRRLHFIRLSPTRALAVLVTDGEALNRAISTGREFSERQLRTAADFYNARLAGMTLEDAAGKLREMTGELRVEIAALLGRMLGEVSAAGEDGTGEGGIGGAGVKVAGEFNLLNEDSLASDIDRLRKLHGLLRRRSDLLNLLEAGSRAENVRVFIGGECGHEALSECSMVLSPYGDGEGKGGWESDRPLGVIGVIGPKRMTYDRVIPAVRLTARAIGKALRKLRAEG